MLKEFVVKFFGLMALIVVCVAAGFWMQDNSASIDRFLLWGLVAVVGLAIVGAILRFLFTVMGITFQYGLGLDKRKN